MQNYTASLYTGAIDFAASFNEVKNNLASCSSDVTGVVDHLINWSNPPQGLQNILSQHIPAKEHILNVDVTQAWEYYEELNFMVAGKAIGDILYTSIGPVVWEAQSKSELFKV